MTPSPQGPRGLAATGVSVSFSGISVLSDVHLRLTRNEILGLIGPNGAGKTTLVNVISGYQQSDEGSVHLDGRGLDGSRPHQRARAGLARTFQGVRPFPRLTVAENVEVAALAGGGRRRKGAAAADQALKPLGLSQVRGSLAETLSAGDQRRLALARALATDPAFLLLDEPAAGLDDVESQELMATISAIRDERDIGILVIDHDMRLIFGLCDRIQVLAEGRTIAEAEPVEVRRSPAVIEAYLGEEAERIDA